MAGLNVSIEDNALLTNYAKKIGLVATRSMQVSINEKWHCKDNYNIKKFVLDGCIKRCLPCQDCFLIWPHPSSPCEKDGWGFFFGQIFVCNTLIWFYVILSYIKLLGHVYLAISQQYNGQQTIHPSQQFI